jgi:small GTP-binding protein
MSDVSERSKKDHKKEKKAREEHEKKLRKQEKKAREEQEKKDRKSVSKSTGGGLLAALTRSRSVSQQDLAVPPTLRANNRDSDSGGSSSSSKRQVPPPKLDSGTPPLPPAVLARVTPPHTESGSRVVRQDTPSSPLEASLTRVLAIPPPILQQRPPAAAAAIVVAPSTAPPALSESAIRRKITTTEGHVSVSQPIMTEAEYHCKVIMLGDAAAGKTSLIRRLQMDEFKDKYEATIGVEFIMYYLTTKDQHTMRMQIWDTSGQERFKAITTAYYRGSHAAVVVFDMSVANGFDNVAQHIATLQQYCGASVVTDQPLIMVVGSKSDLPALVDEKHVATWCCEHNYLYFKTSAKTGECVRLAFHELGELIYQQRLLRAITATNSSKPTSTVSLSSAPIRQETHPSEQTSTPKRNCAC